MDAMMLAVVRQRLREGRPPARDVVLTFTADEEAGGTWGARWLVDHHPDLFEGVTEAVGEVGGFSLTLGDQRLYLLQTAEKGIAWLRLTARGTAGHGSMIQTDNAVTELAEAIGRLGRHEWPTRLIPSVQAFLTGICAALDIEFIPNDPTQALAKVGTISRIIGATLKNTVIRPFSAPDTRSMSYRRPPPPKSTAASCPAMRKSFSPSSTGCSGRA
jgi:acetylornithine deacetylase/succinyl-diaminopimelate desuccinylase-like protein